MRPGVLNMTPNPDSMQETSSQTNAFSREYGRASSIQMLMTTRRGTEGFHGNIADYFTDQKLAAGTELPNAFTKRMRYLVLDSANSPLQHWVSHSRDVRADFLNSFGTESSTVPPLMAIVVGADADNTGETSLAYVGDVSLVEQ